MDIKSNIAAIIDGQRLVIPTVVDEPGEILSARTANAKRLVFFLQGGEHMMADTGGGAYRLISMDVD